MKTVITIIAVMIAIAVTAAGALADEPVDEVSILSVNASAGITPDSLFWGLDRAVERLEFLLAQNKTRKGIEIALERHLEVRAMILAKKEGHALKAMDAFEDAEAGWPEHVRDGLRMRLETVRSDYASAFGRSVADARMLRQQGLLASSVKNNGSGGYRPDRQS